MRPADAPQAEATKEPAGRVPPVQTVESERGPMGTTRNAEAPASAGKPTREFRREFERQYRAMTGKRVSGRQWKRIVRRQRKAGLL